MQPLNAGSSIHLVLTVLQATEPPLPGGNFRNQHHDLHPTSSLIPRVDRLAKRFIMAPHPTALHAQSQQVLPKIP